VGADGRLGPIDDMFRGATKLTVDDKGRLVMPTRHRDRLRESCGGQLVITVDRDQCLLIYPLPEWEQIERKLMSLPSLHRGPSTLTLCVIQTAVVAGIPDE
jgi:MraZ protein